MWIRCTKIDGPPSPESKDLTKKTGRHRRDTKSFFLRLSIRYIDPGEGSDVTTEHLLRGTGVWHRDQHVLGQMSVVPVSLRKTWHDTFVGQGSLSKPGFVDLVKNKRDGRVVGQCRRRGGRAVGVVFIWENQVRVGIQDKIRRVKLTTDPTQDGGGGLFLRMEGQMSSDCQGPIGKSFTVTGKTLSES